MALFCCGGSTEIDRMPDQISTVFLQARPALNLPARRQIPLLSALVHPRDTVRRNISLYFNFHLQHLYDIQHALHTVLPPWYLFKYWREGKTSHFYSELLL